MSEKTLELQVTNISCEGCARTIEQALSETPGVANATVDVPTKQVTVSYDADNTGEEKIRQAIEAAGYHVAPSG